MEYQYTQLQPTDILDFKSLLRIYGKAFKEEETYQSAIPSEEYIKNFLTDPKHIVLIGKDKGQVIGGLVAYELQKFEQARSELYIYDLAVSQEYQRKGVATQLINLLKDIAKKRKIKTIFVQADKTDKEAVSFYKSFHTVALETFTFDITL